MQEMNESELLMRRRKLVEDVKTEITHSISGQEQGQPVYCLLDIRRTDSMTCIQGN